MIDKDLLTRFWKDFNLITQEEDSNFPIVNPQDAVRALIRCRNWVGTFTEMLVSNSIQKTITVKGLKHENYLLSEIERFWYAELLTEDHSISVLKTKELAQALIAQKTKDDPTYHSIQLHIISLENELFDINSDKDILEMLLRKIEKTTDWLVQYINWTKFELRTLQS